MAEYVRRKRPPATHPYWARMHDRTHPPSGKGAMIFLGMVGLVSGCIFGEYGTLTLGEAIKFSIGLSFKIAIIIGVFGLIGSISEHEYRRPWTSLLMSISSVCLFTFLTFIVLFLLMATYVLWIYWPVSGLGTFKGGLVGTLICLALATVFTWAERRNWWRRQENWPKWEEMARGHRRRRFIVRETPTPTDGQQLPTGNA